MIPETTGLSNAISEVAAEREAPEEVAFIDRLGLVYSDQEKAAQPPGWVDAKLDAILERMAGIDEEIAANTVAQGLRVQMIADHFEAESYALARRREYLEDQIRRIALGYPFPGSKKSRKLPSGTFGFRKVIEKVRIADRKKAEAFAQVHWRGAVEKVPATTKLVAKTLTDAVLEWIGKTGEIPDPSETGLEYIEANERGTFFVKTGA